MSNGDHCVEEIRERFADGALVGIGTEEHQAMAALLAALDDSRSTREDAQRWQRRQKKTYEKLNAEAARASKAEYALDDLWCAARRAVRKLEIEGMRGAVEPRSEYDELVFAVAKHDAMVRELRADVRLDEPPRAGRLLRAWHVGTGYIGDACAQLVEKANESGETETLYFNGTAVYAKPDSDPIEVADGYWESRRKTEGRR